MSCCNNDCLENIPAGCILSPEGLSCIEGINLSQNLTSIDNMLSELYCNNPSGTSILDQHIEIDLKCLANTECTEYYFNYAFAKNPNPTIGGWVFSINLEDSFPYFYNATYYCYINSTLYSSGTGSYFQVSGTTQSQLINGVSIIVTVNLYTPLGVSVYTKSLILFPSTPNFASVQFDCASNTSVQVLKIKQILELLIDKVC